MSDELSGKRVTTKYPGVYFRLAKRKGRAGTERVYYVTYRQGNRKREVRAYMTRPSVKRKTIFRVSTGSG